MKPIAIIIKILFISSMLGHFSSCKTQETLDKDVTIKANTQTSDNENSLSEVDTTNIVTVETRKISGIVIGPDGEPISEATVSTVVEGRSAISDMKGHFTLTTDQVGSIKIKVTAEGFDDHVKLINRNTEDLVIGLLPILSVIENIMIDDKEYEDMKSESAGDVAASATIMVTESSPAMSRSESPRAKSRPAPARGRAIEGKIRPGTGSAQADYSAGQLTAGEWNDLSRWDEWNKLLENQDYNEMQDHWKIFPRTRYSIFVRNQYELPVQDAKVELLSKTGKILWTSRTDNAGRAELWADVNQREKSFESVDARVSVGFEKKTVKNLKSNDAGVNHIDVKAECNTAQNVDIVFAVDATGSMGDEIKFLQSELTSVIERSLDANTALNVRLGAVFYRDSTDEYITNTQPLSNDPQKTLDFISAQYAKGGGDYPEAVDAALEASLAQDWSEEAVARIVFLVLDAPPHHNPSVLAKLQQQIADAAAEGIKIIPITASGINRQTEFLMKFMAIGTNGTYVFITDHSGIGNAHLDPVVQNFEVEKLDDLLVRLLFNYTKSNGCDANETSSNKIEIYPNPAQDRVNVKTDREVKTIRILSNTGKLIKTKSDVAPGELQIDLSGLIDGIYTIHFQGENFNESQPLVIVNR